MHGIDWTLFLNHAKDIASGLLMVLGGLSIIAKYTKWNPDERVIGYVEQAIKIFIMAIPTLLAIIAAYGKKKDGTETTKQN